jgi:hypothetical protein
MLYLIFTGAGEPAATPRRWIEQRRGECRRIAAEREEGTSKCQGLFTAIAVGTR